MLDNTPSENGESGASLVEFALCVGVLLFLIFGVIETGRIITQLPWVSQTLYEITLTGSENLTSAGVNRMGNKSNQFSNQLNKALSAFTLNAGYESRNFVDSAGRLREIRLVTAELSGELIPIINFFDYDLGLKYTAIHAATAQPLDVSLADFGLVDNQRYLCDTVTKCGPPASALLCPTAPCCNVGPCIQ